MIEILICTHDPMLVKGLCNPFRDAGYSVTTADHAMQAIQLMARRHFAALVLDSCVMGMSPAEALPVIRRVSPLTKVVVLGDSRLEHDAWTVPRTADFEEVRAIVAGCAEQVFNNMTKERV
jgi:DNA-binding response OmpR family regulator